MKVDIPRERIIRDQELFHEKYLPDSILMRERQVRELTNCLAPALRKSSPFHVWLYGPAGAGKTATARYVLQQLKREHRLLGVYVNCWEQSSLYFVLSKILDDLRIVHTDVRDTSFKRERLLRSLRGEPLIVILDEIDKPAPHERNAILYNLSRLDKSGLISICNSRYFYFMAEDRVKSRIAPVQIEFPPYSLSEVAGILKSRAELGMVEGSWDSSHVRRIAELSAGDARAAIQAFLRAGLMAEQERCDKIQPGHIRRAWTRAMNNRKSYMLHGLTEDHRVIYDIVAGKGQVLSGKLFVEYRAQCQAIGRIPIAIRTFSNYVSALVSAKLITVERARVPGKVRLLKVA